jgi:hypothetical protein
MRIIGKLRRQRKVQKNSSILFCCSCASAAGDVGLLKQTRFLHGRHVPRMRPACGIPVSMQELETARPLGIYIYMQYSTTSVIARTMSAKMPSAVVTFLLPAVLLVMCEYGSGLKLAIIYKSVVLKYCVNRSFIFFF